MAEVVEAMAELVPSTPRPTVAGVGIVTRTRPKSHGLWECPRCLSRFVQPMEWEVKPNGRVAIELRCPECFTWRSGTFEAERVREMDRMLVRGRSELRAVYGRTVRDNMYRELDSFTQALALDLIGPDDFLPRLQSRCFSYQP